MRHILLGLIVVAAAATQAKATRIDLWAGDNGPDARVKLEPNMPGQEIPFYVRTVLEGTPGELTLEEAKIAIAGLYLSIGNGGDNFSQVVTQELTQRNPGALPFVTEDGPKITGLSLAGSIWEDTGVPLALLTRFPANEFGNPARTDYPVQALYYQIETDPPPIGGIEQTFFFPADGLLFTMIVDTTGFQNDRDKEWSLEYGDWLANDGIPDAFLTSFGLQGPAEGSSQTFFLRTGEQAIVIPEPSSWILAGLGIALAGFVGWRRRRRAA